MLIRKVVVTLAIASVYACGGGTSKEDKTGNPAGDPQSTADPAPSGTIDAQAMMPMPGARPPVTTPPITSPALPPVTTPPVTSPVSPPVTTPPITSPVSPPVTTPPITQPVAPTPAPVVQNAFQHLPVLSDADGNPNDLSGTYNLTADSNVPVQVVTPSGTWTTPMMRYNGLQLPPVIKAKRGTNITVNIQNNLAEATTVHWHGFKIPAIQDGGPDTPIAAGAPHTYSFQLNQAAAPLWFHPHADGTTATQVYNGLAGAFVVTDEISDSLEASKSLPTGAFDIPLLVQDRTFAADNGSGIRPLVYGGMMVGMSGMLGDRILINNVEQPSLNVETRQYRFRIFNGSNARTYDFALSNGATFRVIATDGGLLPSPVVTDHVVLAAGERSEIVVDFRGAGVNDSLALVNRSTANRVVMQFNVTTLASDDVTLYSSLPQGADIYTRLTAADATATRNFVMSMAGMMGGFVINGRLFDINRVDERVTAGATEIWNISNTTGMAHPFHAHAIQWQILDRNNIPASGIDLGWKDTVLVQPGESVRFIGRFDPVINRGLYYYHCHILEHEEAGMMGSFSIQ